MRLLCDSAVVVCWSCGVKKITEAHKVSDGVVKAIETHFWYGQPSPRHPPMITTLGRDVFDILKIYTTLLYIAM